MKKYLSDEARKAKNEYYREWRKNNPEKVRASQQKFWAKKAKEKELLQKETRKEEG